MKKLHLCDFGEFFNYGYVLQTNEGLYWVDYDKNLYFRDIRNKDNKILESYKSMDEVFKFIEKKENGKIASYGFNRN